MVINTAKLHCRWPIVLCNDRGEIVGGPMYYISRGLGTTWLAVLFAIFGFLASFGIGASVQANSLAGSVNATFGIPLPVIGVVVAVFAGLVLIGGINAYLSLY